MSEFTLPTPNSPQNSECAFITVHGIDGTGKTTTVQLLAERLNSLGIPTINYDEYERGLTNPLSIAKTGVLKETSPSTQFAALSRVLCK